MEKKIQFVTQAKGGAGKSVLTFMLAEKYKDAVILDLDDATTTSLKQLAYREPKRVTFLDAETKRIDRGAFNELFESIILSKHKLFIADLGASVAEQLPKYFEMNGVENIIEILNSSNIELQVICVVAGGNNFKASMGYLVELVDASQGKLNIVVAPNGYHPLTDEQTNSFQAFVSEYKLQVSHFDLAKDKGEMALRTVQNVLQAGKGIAGLSPFTSIYFKKPIEDLKL